MSMTDISGNGFHQYICGSRVIAETDHKPLIAIANKDFDAMSPRIQRMMMRRKASSG